MSCCSGGGRAGGAAGRRRTVTAEEDGDLDFVVPVALHLVDLQLQHAGGADEGQGHERHQDDRDHHGQVAAQAAADLGEDELEPHSWPSPAARASARVVGRRGGGLGFPAAGIPQAARLAHDRNHGGVEGLGLVADDDAVAEFDDAFAHLVDDVVVVRGHDHGGAVLVDLVQHAHDAHGGGGVQVAGGLIGQQDARAVDDGAGDRHALLLAAGEFVREAVFLAFEADGLEDLGHGVADDAAALADDLHGEGDVGEHGFLRQQAEVLEHDADPAAEPGHAPAGDVGDVLAGHVDGAGGGAVLFEDEAQEGRFAGAGGADEEGEFATVDLKVDRIQRGSRLLVIDLGDIFETDHGPKYPAGRGRVRPSSAAGARAF